MTQYIQREKSTVIFHKNDTMGYTRIMQYTIFTKLKTELLFGHFRVKRFVEHSYFYFRHIHI